MNLNETFMDSRYNNGASNGIKMRIAIVTSFRETKQKGFKFEFNVFEPGLIVNRNEFRRCIDMWLRFGASVIVLLPMLTSKFDLSMIWMESQHFDFSDFMKLSHRWSATTNMQRQAFKVARAYGRTRE